MILPDLALYSQREVGANVKGDRNYMSSLGKNYHVMMEMKVMCEVDGDQRANHKEKRRNYEKTNLAKLERFFSEVNFERMQDMDKVRQKYKCFNIYEKGRRKCVLMQRIR